MTQKGEKRKYKIAASFIYHKQSLQLKKLVVTRAFRIYNSTRK